MADYQAYEDYIRKEIALCATDREHIEMFSPDADAANTWDRPDRILPRKNTETRAEKGILTARLQKESWNVLRFRSFP